MKSRNLEHGMDRAHNLYKGGLMIEPGDIISYLDMCQEECVNLQRGMNFKLRYKDVHSVYTSFHFSFLDKTVHTTPLDVPFSTASCNLSTILRRL